MGIERHILNRKAEIKELRSDVAKERKPEKTILRMTQMEYEPIILVYFTITNLSVPGFGPSNSCLCAAPVMQICTKGEIMSR